MPALGGPPRGLPRLHRPGRRAVRRRASTWCRSDPTGSTHWCARRCSTDARGRPAFAVREVAGGGGPPPAGQEGIGRVSKDVDDRQRLLPAPLAGAPTYLCRHYTKAPWMTASRGGHSTPPRGMMARDDDDSRTRPRTGASRRRWMDQHRRIPSRCAISAAVSWCSTSGRSAASTACASIEELRPLEERFGDRLVVIGVHSPKFPHESDHASVATGGRPAPNRPPGAGRSRAGDVAAVRRSRVADAGRDRPRRLRGRDGLGRGQRARARDASSPTCSRAATISPPDPRSAGPGRRRAPRSPFRARWRRTGTASIAIADTGNDRSPGLRPRRQCPSCVRRLPPAAGGAFRRRTPAGVRHGGGRTCGRVPARRRAPGARLGAALAVGRRWCCVTDASRLPRRVCTGSSRSGAEVVRPRCWRAAGAEGLRDGPAREAHLAQPSGLTAARR